MAETIDKLFLELSHVTNAKTERELHLERKLEGLEMAFDLLLSINEAMANALITRENNGNVSFILAPDRAEAYQKAHKDSTNLLQAYGRLGY